MLHRKDIPIQEYENSRVKNEYDYLYKKDEELKGDNVTDENEGIVDVCLALFGRFQTDCWPQN